MYSRLKTHLPLFVLVLFLGKVGAADPAVTATPAPGVTPSVSPTTAAAIPISEARPTPLVSTPTSTSTNALDNKLKLGIGDRLSYRIVEDLEEPKSIVVTDSGDIEVPLIGRIPA